MSNITKYLMIAGAIIFPNIGGWLGGIIVSENLNPWFNSLIKPALNPPNYVFGPAWTIIYCSIGLASYLVYAKLVSAGKGFNLTAQVALSLYVIQLALNWAWTPIFFKYHSLKWSAYEISVLIIVAILNGVAFGRINKIAGLLFVPYILWLAYASYLNWELYRLNA